MLCAYAALAPVQLVWRGVVSNAPSRQTRFERQPARGGPAGRRRACSGAKSSKAPPSVLERPVAAVRNSDASPLPRRRDGIPWRRYNVIRTWSHADAHLIGHRRAVGGSVTAAWETGLTPGLAGPRVYQSNCAGFGRPQEVRIWILWRGNCTGAIAAEREAPVHRGAGVEGLIPSRLHRCNWALLMIMARRTQLATGLAEGSQRETREGGRSPSPGLRRAPSPSRRREPRRCGRPCGTPRRPCWATPHGVRLAARLQCSGRLVRTEVR